MIVSPDHYIIALGSNINPEKNIADALKMIEKNDPIIKQSQILKTAPIGIKYVPDFLNTCVLIASQKSLIELKTELKKIEDLLGRIRDKKNIGLHTIDLDIILHNEKIIDHSFYKFDFLPSLIAELKISA